MRRSEAWADGSQLRHNPGAGMSHWGGPGHIGNEPWSSQPPHLEGGTVQEMTSLAGFTDCKPDLRNPLTTVSSQSPFSATDSARSHPAAPARTLFGPRLLCLKLPVTWRSINFLGLSLSSASQSCSSGLTQSGPGLT